MKRLLLCLALTLFALVPPVHAVPYVPQEDADATLRILKAYRDILNEKYGISLPSNAHIQHEKTGAKVQAAVFIEAVDRAGFSLDETINRYLDAEKEPLSHKTYSGIGNTEPKVVVLLFSALERHILTLPKGQEAELGISPETRLKIWFWYSKEELLSQLDISLIRGDQKNTDQVISMMEKYGAFKELRPRRILMLFAGLGGVAEDRDAALKAAEAALAEEKLGVEADIYKALPMRIQAESGAPTHWDEAVKVFWNPYHTWHIKPVLAYSLLLNGDADTLSPLSKNIEKADPFSRYVYALAALEWGEIGYRSTPEERDAARAELTPGWAAEQAMRMVEKKKESSDVLNALAFYALAPNDEETAALLANGTARQKGYAALLEKTLIPKRYAGHWESFRRDGEYSPLEIDFFAISEDGRTPSAYILGRNSMGKLKINNFSGAINRRPFALNALEFYFRGTGKTHAFSKDSATYQYWLEPYSKFILRLRICDDGSLVGQTFENSTAYVTLKPASIPDKSAAPAEPAAESNAAQPAVEEADTAAPAPPVQVEPAPGRAEALPGTDEPPVKDQAAAAAPGPYQPLAADAQGKPRIAAHFVKQEGDRVYLAVQLLAPGRTAVAMRIDNLGGVASSWRSDGKEKAASLELQGAALGSALPDGEVLLESILTDNGAFAGKKTDFRVTVFLDGGERVMCQLDRGSF